MLTNTRQSVFRVNDSPVHTGMSGNETELEEILLPQASQNGPLTGESVLHAQSEPEWDSDDEDDDDGENARTVMAKKVAPRPLLSGQTPAFITSGLSTTLLLNPNGSQLTSANMSNVSLKIHSPSHSISRSIHPPGTPDHVEDLDTLDHIRSPSQPAGLGGGNSNRISPTRPEDRRISHMTPDGKLVDPTALTVPSNSKHSRQHSNGGSSFSTKKGFSGLTIQTNVAALQNSPPMGNSSLSQPNMTPKGPNHRRNSSWMSEEVHTPVTAFPGAFIPSSMGGVHNPPSTADRQAITQSQTSRIHVIRIQENKKASQNFGRIPMNKRGHGNYKMPSDPFYKNQSQVNRERDLGLLKPKKTHEEELEEEDMAKFAVKLGSTRWHQRLDMPVFRDDGELEPSYLAQKERKRQFQVLGSFYFYTFFYFLLELPYVMYVFHPVTQTDTSSIAAVTGETNVKIFHSEWLWDKNLIPLVVRFGVMLVLIGCAIFIRKRVSLDRKSYYTHVASHSHSLNGYRFFPVDSIVGALACFGASSMIVIEGFRDEDFMQDNELLQDGLLLGLTLIISYMVGVLRLSRVQNVIQCLFIFLLYNGCSYFLFPAFSLNYLAKTDSYLVLLVISLAIYNSQLRDVAKRDIERKKAVNFERKKADKLLRSMLPGSVYTTVLEGRNPYLSGISTIGFCNVELTYDENAKPSPAELMQRLHDTFKRIDGIVSVYKVRGVHKIETVSKTYLMCCGLLEEVEDHTASMVDVCLEILHMIQGRNQKTNNSKITSGLKIGIATGPVVGGIIGTTRRFFRVFGDTVNVAARMCTNCSSWQIQCNKYAHDSLNEIQRSQYKFPPMRVLEIKGKGSMQCYLVERRDDWVPRFSKAVMNRGKEGEGDEEGVAKDLSSSFVFHNIIKNSSLQAFPSLQYQSTFEHHDTELLKSEGPSANTSQHIEYRFQIQQFNLWMPKTKWNIAWFFIWLILAFAAVAYQKIHLDFGNSLGDLGLNFPILFGTIIVMIAIHFISSYALASNNLFKKHTQAFTGMYAFFICCWILAVLELWGLNDGPIAPHFAFILLTLYTCMFLHLQIRFVAPLTAATIVGFIVLLSLKRYHISDIIFCISYLITVSSFILYGCLKAENRTRANYLIQYALDMEQGQMDNFLKNLLPQFVVNVLKKKSPATQATTTKRGSIVSDPTTQSSVDILHEAGDTSARSPDPGLRVVSALASSNRAKPTHQRRRSVFDQDAEFGGGGGGGLASRFAMNFPNATVFESDIVGYTKLVSSWPAQRTLNMLNDLFIMFDSIAMARETEKIETIGDAFMCVRFENEPDAVLHFAIDVIAALKQMNASRVGEQPIEIRSGVCTGPCYGGVVGSDVPRFHMFGIAHDGSILLEQNGKPMAAMVSDSVYEQAKERFQFERRPEIQCDGMNAVYQLMGRKGADAEKDLVSPTTTGAKTGSWL